MDFRKLGFGLGAFAAGAVVWTLGAARYGDKGARLLRGAGAAGAKAVGVPGDATTAAIDPRPATMAAAPADTAETGERFAERPGSPAIEHVPTDLLGDARVGSARAPDAFRPDPTAVPTAEEREALRPATGPAPTMVADRGSGFSDAAGAA